MMAEYTDADVELAARALADLACLANWDHMPDDHKNHWRVDARAVLTDSATFAALAAAGRDYAAGVAEGRRQAAADIAAKLDAEADDEAARPNRTGTSYVIEGWLREAAGIAARIDEEGEDG